MKQLACITMMIFALISIGACSNGSSDPVLGVSTPGYNAQTDLANEIPIIEMSIMDNGIFDAVGLLGAYELVINTDSMSADLVSKRASSIGESYIVNGISYFTISPCADCLKLKSIALTEEGFLQVSFIIKHPFDPGDVLKPPTAINRLDLDVFDVALVVHPVEEVPASYTLSGASAYPDVLVNASGYTTELANVIEDDAVLPYFLVIDDNSAGTDTFNKFGMGDETEFDVFFDPSEGVRFDLYLTMGYGASAKKPQRLMPTYYNPEFNRKSAWKVIVSPPNGDDPPVMGNTWDDGDNATAFDVTVEVFDWQIGANVDSELTNTTDVYAASEVSSVSMEIPGMNSSLISVTTEDSGSGAPDDPLVYTLSAANENLLEAGEYFGLVKVTDERVPGTVLIGGETDTLVDSPDGVTINWVEIPEFATYQTFTATVVVGCGPITGSITNPTCPISNVASGSSINFEATASSDNGGDPIVLYEWDEDYDGITFDVDDTGDSVTLGPYINPNCGTPPEDPVTYTVAVRATDSCSPSNTTLFDTCEVIVDLCIGPSVGNITLTVNRQGSNNVLDDSGPFTIEWADPGVSYVEYAVYVDTVPSDGFTNSLSEVGTTTGLSFTDPGTNLPGNHYIVGWTYVVYGRSQAGNPSSEGVESEPAHVMFNGWETFGHRQNPGIGNNGEGWNVHHESSSTHFMAWPNSYGYGWAPQGNYCMWYTPYCSTYYDPPYSGVYQGMTKETPVIPDSTVRHLEFCGRIWQIHDTSGVFIGTLDYEPFHNFNDHDTRFDWASVLNASPYHGYTTEAADINNWISDGPIGANNAWSLDGYDTVFHRRGGDVNIDGDPSDSYVAIEMVNMNPWQPYFMMDEVAIVIY